MAWTNPAPWSFEYIVSAADFNEQLRDNMNYLKAAFDRVFHAKAFTILDLSGAAQADVVVLHSSVAATISRVILLYTEASSSDAGITIEVGKETDDDYYYTGTTDTDEAEWGEVEVVLLQTALAAGDTLVCSHAGGKTGIGEILVCVEYTVDI